jgi:hypothetical protein
VESFFKRKPEWEKEGEALLGKYLKEYKRDPRNREFVE